MAVAGIVNSLWDLRGRIEGKPVGNDDHHDDDDDDDKEDEVDDDAYEEDDDALRW